MCGFPDIARRYSVRANSFMLWLWWSFNPLLHSVPWALSYVQECSVDVAILIGFHHFLLWLLVDFCNSLLLFEIKVFLMKYKATVIFRYTNNVYRFFVRDYAFTKLMVVNSSPIIIIWKSHSFWLGFHYQANPVVEQVKSS